jgi:hypothetical protein
VQKIKLVLISLIKLSKTGNKSSEKKNSVDNFFRFNQKRKKTLLESEKDCVTVETTPKGSI